MIPRMIPGPGKGGLVPLKYGHFWYLPVSFKGGVVPEFMMSVGFWGEFSSVGFGRWRAPGGGSLDCHGFLVDDGSTRVLGGSSRLALQVHQVSEPHVRKPWSLAIWKVEQPFSELGTYTITMMIDHLLTGMILQVITSIYHILRGWVLSSLAQPQSTVVTDSPLSADFFVLKTW